MSKKKPADTEDTPKKGGKLKLVILMIFVLALGAGGAYGAFAMGLIHTGGESEPDVPRLVAKDEEDPFAPEGEASETGPVTYGEGGNEYRASYFEFEEGFTSNLKDSPGLVQVTLAASTYHDGRVIQWLELHELAIRSAILVELANTVEDDVYTVEGKERLQQRLTAAVNRVLEEHEGFGGVETIHFQTFLVQ
ncbi:flagellar basal body-associated FliL family protein [Erythrobacter sp. EC-HK427]|uniref:flagellar basal body-associated FliL family protein n=1 Tax=Erythrobacter sp. EC-HK427 TaxID=2038396 RepID=UPI00125250D1|nr:flagellar basal body-associated FliL family protein [Erythrobacter sp. EC-HK427]VVT01699.1 Flagellar protein FliL [Erythrobacter sp. EC-HK427]